MLLQEQEKLYMVEEFWEIARLPENEERRLELDEGIIVDMGASSKRNTVAAGRLIHFLNAHVIPNDLGVVTTPDAGFKLGTRKYRQPDTTFIAKATSSVDLEGTYFTIAPDLAVEVVSPDEDVFKKAREYLQAGTRLVWAVYTDEKKVFVFQLTAAGEMRIREYGLDDTLDGGDVLPGFTLPVRDIFPG